MRPSCHKLASKDLHLTFAKCRVSPSHTPATSSFSVDGRSAGGGAVQAGCGDRRSCAARARRAGGVKKDAEPVDARRVAFL